jgi:uncharacterized protein YceK
MRRPVAVCLALITACPLSGCATAWNLKNEQQIYGGVRREASIVPYLMRDFAPAKPEDGFSTVLSMGALADLPFSAIGDTLTLPVTIPATLMKLKELNARKKIEPGMQATPGDDTD